MYEYRATVTRVVDGDSCVCDIDLGFSVWVRKCPIRLDGLDTPELPTTAGLAARVALTDLVLDKSVILRTRKDVDDKYGRMLGVILLPNLGGIALNVNEYLLTNGYAKPYSGGTRA